MWSVVIYVNESTKTVNELLKFLGKIRFLFLILQDNKSINWVSCSVVYIIVYKAASGFLIPDRFIPDWNTL